VWCGAAAALGVTHDGRLSARPLQSTFPPACAYCTGYVPPYNPL